MEQAVREFVAILDTYKLRTLGGREESDTKFAKRLGIKRETLSRWRNCRVIPSVEIVMSIANRLNCTFEELYEPIIRAKKVRDRYSKIRDSGDPEDDGFSFGHFPYASLMPAVIQPRWFCLST